MFSFNLIMKIFHSLTLFLSLIIKMLAKICFVRKQCYSQSDMRIKIESILRSLSVLGSDF